MRKTGTCMKCSGGDPSLRNGNFFDAGYDDAGRPTWTCRCCGTVTPRRVLVTKRSIERRARTARAEATFNALLGGVL